jgi:hypothetical protein
VLVSCWSSEGLLVEQWGSNPLASALRTRFSSFHWLLHVPIHYPKFNKAAVRKILNTPCVLTHSYLLPYSRVNLTPKMASPIFYSDSALDLIVNCLSWTNLKRGAKVQSRCSSGRVSESRRRDDQESNGALAIRKSTTGHIAAQIVVQRALFLIFILLFTTFNSNKQPVT